MNQHPRIFKSKGDNFFKDLVGAVRQWGYWDEIEEFSCCCSNCSGAKSISPVVWFEDQLWTFNFPMIKEYENEQDSGVTRTKSLD